MVDTAAAEAIRGATFLFIAAGAGLSADSGLPVFAQVGKEEAYVSAGLSYSHLSSVDMLVKAPELFYGFWYQSQQRYATATPHEGYGILLEWFKTVSQRQPEDWDGPPALVCTSNVDGAFALSGFPETAVCQIHGSVHRWQCSGVPDHARKHSVRLLQHPPCSAELYPAPPVGAVDPVTLRCTEPPPPCPRGCGGYLRPNVYMFGDGDMFVETEEVCRSALLDRWQAAVLAHLARHPASTLAIVELGCGIRIPSLRKRCEEFASQAPRGQVTFVRVNPEWPGKSCCFEPTLPLKATALEALRALAAAGRGATAST